MRIIERTEIVAADYFVSVEKGNLSSCYMQLPMLDTPFNRARAKEHYLFYTGTPPLPEGRMCAVNFDLPKMLNKTDFEGDSYLKSLFGISVYDEQVIIDTLKNNILLIGLNTK